MLFDLWFVPLLISFNDANLTKGHFKKKGKALLKGDEHYKEFQIKTGKEKDHENKKIVKTSIIENKIKEN